MLSSDQVEHFITAGYVQVNNAFSSEVAEAATEILWKDLPCSKSNPASWTEPVIRLGMYSQRPFIDSVNSTELHAAFDQLVGMNKWIPCKSVGTFPVRFPTSKQPKDTGKHVDASFPGDEPANYLSWRVNVKSKGRALLMLVLYSDVDENDAPTIIYKGSHMDVARLLYPEGDLGLSFMDLANRLNELPEREKAYATGKAGTIYLCHPFVVHAAQSHAGATPKFMAQPPLQLRDELSITDLGQECAPIEQAIRFALNLV